MNRNNIFYLFTLMTLMLGMASCSENVEDENEYPDWQKTNEEWYDSFFKSSKALADSGNPDWMIIRNWSYQPNTATSADDHIVVNVLQHGTGSGCPLYTDSVRVHYRGRLLPTKNYPDGYVFDQSYTGEFSPETCVPTKFAVSGVCDGFSTALQNMRIGDHWVVYIPYKLGYGKDEQGSVPGYSTMIFEIYLAAYYRPGPLVPDYGAKESCEWIEE